MNSLPAVKKFLSNTRKNAVVLIVLVGWFIGEYRPMSQTAIRVNDAKFSMGYYIDALKNARMSQPADSTLNPAEYLQNITDSVVKEIEQFSITQPISPWHLF